MKRTSGNRSVTRARGAAGEPTPSPAAVREERVRHVMGLMADGRWDGQHEELAAVWGVSAGTVEHYAGEASRRVRAACEGEWVRQRIAVALDELLEHALRLARKGDARAIAAGASAARTFAEVVGGKVGKPEGDERAEPLTFRVELSIPERPATITPEIDPDSAEETTPTH